MYGNKLSFVIIAIFSSTFLFSATLIHSFSVQQNIKVESVGTFIVKVNIAGAEVRIDGEVLAVSEGPGDVEIQNVKAGYHTISVTREGYDSNFVNQDYWIIAGQRYSEQVRLEKQVRLEPRKDGYFDRAGIEYVRIPAGEFIMGAVSIDKAGYYWEKPAHRITISREFWMSTTEVTVEAYRMFCIETGRKMPNWHYSGHPIALVSWHDAKAYCEWSGGRLPTEAEWEYAARAGREETIYAWGNEVIPRVNGIVRVNVSDENVLRYYPDAKDTYPGYDDGYTWTSPVGSYPPNGFGLFDMCGNVSEWCSDWFDPRYYEKSQENDPKGPEAGKERVIRGGSYISRDSQVRSGINSARISDRSGRNPDNDASSIGIRVVRDSPPEFRGNESQLRDLTQAEQNEYEKAVRANNVESWRTFINLFPDSQHVNEARKKIITISQRSVNRVKTKQEKTAKRLKLDLEFVNSIGMKFRLIPEGSFQMGSNYDRADEQPVHLVTISEPFYMGMYEVTRAQFEKIMNVGNSFKRDNKKPAVNVDWVDAEEFCRKLSELTGDYYRLPTEAEWEYACRAGSTTAFSWGWEFSEEFSWYGANSGRETHPVGQKKPNAWGLYDMTGNVWEWCSDRYSADYYSRSPELDPRGPAIGLYRVKRGGSWNSDRTNGFRSFDRRREWPILYYTVEGDRGNGPSDDIGIRVVRVIGDQAKEIVQRWKEAARAVEEAFEKAQHKDSIDSWREFIVRYPDSSFAEKALERLAILQKALEQNNVETRKFYDSSSNLPQEVTNSIGMKFRLIPPGSFKMGPDEGFEWFGELPAHTITISKSFYIGIYEVTREQYERIMGSDPSEEINADLPASQVSWNEAVEFCRKLSAIDNAIYRLPTEAEWEYACRAGTSTNYYWGDELDDDYVNTSEELIPVGQKKPNAWGLYDMSGNAREWCLDRFDLKWYSRSPRIDPMGPSTGKKRIVRGGSFNDLFAHWGFLSRDPETGEIKQISAREYYKDIVRSASRDGRPPSLIINHIYHGQKMSGDISSIGNIGFRVVREVEK